LALARYNRLKFLPPNKIPADHRVKHRAAVRRAKSLLEMSRYYEEARQLSRRITAWAMTLGPRPRRFVICSGGGPGIMEAANRGATEAGGKSIGLSIELPHEQFANAYISPELSFNFHYLFMRKLWFAQIAKALIIFPRLRTLDELMILTSCKPTSSPSTTSSLSTGENINRFALEGHGEFRHHQRKRVKCCSSPTPSMSLQSFRWPREVPHASRFFFSI
jgi:predicted Rossmann-fold nucleotide-binding protein